jgi:hypothetical protein
VGRKRGTWNLERGRGRGRETWDVDVGRYPNYVDKKYANLFLTYNVYELRSRITYHVSRIAYHVKRAHNKLTGDDSRQCENDFDYACFNFKNRLS